VARVRYLPVSITSVGGICLVRLVGAIDIATSPRLRTVLATLVAGAQMHVVVDLSAVEYIDCSVIGALIFARGRAARGGGSLRAVAAQPMVLHIMQLTGTDKVLAAGSSLAEALGVLPRERTAGDDRGQEAAELLLRVRRYLPDGAPERDQLRAEAIESAVPFATGLARRFRDRGQPQDDLDQVAALGLVKAVDRYDPQLGNEFAAYAAPTILGEVRRYFRDNGGHLHVPRRLQDLRVRVVRAQGVLAQQMGRSPTTADLAWYLDVRVTDVVAALAAGQAYAPRSLSTPAVGEAPTGFAERLGEPDAGMDAVDLRETVGPAVARLPERQRRILAMRFADNLTQSEIGQRLGISQMQVSRLLGRALRSLRSALSGG
jgi:RNA polymerase sigma-B factor